MNTPSETTFTHINMATCLAGHPRKKRSIGADHVTALVFGVVEKTLAAADVHMYAS